MGGLESYKFTVNVQYDDKWNFDTLESLRGHTAFRSETFIISCKRL